MPRQHDSEIIHRAARSGHWIILSFCVMAVVFSFALENRTDERVAFRFLPERPLPHTCWLRMFADPGCPGCGLTRSFIHLSRGDWFGSLAAHRLGWLIALLVLLQIPLRILALRGSGPLAANRTGPARRAAAIALVGALIANWLLTVALHA